MKRFQIHLPEPMLSRFEAIAEKRDYSVAEIMRSALEKYLDEEEKKEKSCGSS